MTKSKAQEQQFLDLIVKIHTEKQPRLKLEELIQETYRFKLPQKYIDDLIHEYRENWGTGNDYEDEKIYNDYWGLPEWE